MSASAELPDFDIEPITCGPQSEYYAPICELIQTVFTENSVGGFRDSASRLRAFGAITLEDELIGVATLDLASTRPTIESDSAVISYVAVEQLFHGKGIGTQLVLAAEREAKAEGLHRTVLYTTRDVRPAIYERLGYEYRMDGGMEKFL